jgi:hypothetical protein
METNESGKRIQRRVWRDGSVAGYFDSSISFRSAAKPKPGELGDAYCFRNNDRDFGETAVELDAHRPFRRFLVVSPDNSLGARRVTRSVPGGPIIVRFLLALARGNVLAST